MQTQHDRGVTSEGGTFKNRDDAEEVCLLVNMEDYSKETCVSVSVLIREIIQMWIHNTFHQEL